MELSLEIFIKSLLTFLTVGAWVIGVPSFIITIFSIILYFLSNTDEGKSITSSFFDQKTIKNGSIITVFCLTWIITSFIL